MMRATESERERKIFVSQLDKNCTEKSIKEIFSKYGKVVQITIPIHRDGQRKGFAIVEYSSQNEAIIAVNDSNNHTINGRELHVELCDSLSSAGNDLYNEEFHRRPRLKPMDEAYVKYPRRSPDGEEMVPLPMAPPTPPPSPRPSPPPLPEKIETQNKQEETRHSRREERHHRSRYEDDWDRRRSHRR